MWWRNSTVLVPELVALAPTAPPSLSFYSLLKSLAESENKCCNGPVAILKVTPFLSQLQWVGNSGGPLLKITMGVLKKIK